LYESFFGFAQKPFSLLPNPYFLYGSRTHRIAINLLQYGLEEQTGYVVLTGEVGTGKTTLLRELLHRSYGNLTIGLVTNTHQSFGELMKWILQAYDISFRDKDRVEQHQALLDFVIERYASGKRVVLIIDEAQNLSGEALEQLRMLSNINSENDHLLQIIMVGQPELRQILSSPQLRQFVQRIAVDYHLEPLNVEETTAYIAHRLQAAGGKSDLFTAEACRAAHFFSGGVPRLINAVCDYALVFAFADERQLIDVDTVLDAAAERMQGGLGSFTRLPDTMSREQLRHALVTGEPLPVAAKPPSQN
jgi:general secretion pathway protein A